MREDMHNSRERSSRPTILVIDDDDGLTGPLRSLLEEEGFAVVLAGDGADGLRLAYQLYPHLILLDLVRPKLRGLQVLRRLRQISSVPVIVIGERAAHQALVEGLHAGADDFVSIPYAPAELVARVRALLRRVSRPSSWVCNPDALRTIGQMVVDYETRSVTVRGRDIPLTPTEFRLLTCLLSSVEATVSYQSLTREVWGANDPSYQRHLRLYIGYLRHKIEDDPSHPKYILTDRRRGYRLSTPPPS